MFSKKPAPANRPNVAKGMAGHHATFSVIGPDVTITGDITASADLHVDGKVEGDITCAALVQGDTSSITGSVVAQSMRLAGEVRGTISARELVILKTARIDGDVHYDALTIEQGAQVSGRFAPRAAPSEKSAEEIVEPLRAIAN
jgi:cytoskeletal protein CcmA (bactofilin family)